MAVGKKIQFLNLFVHLLHVSCIFWKLVLLRVFFKSFLSFLVFFSVKLSKLKWSSLCIEYPATYLLQNYVGYIFFKSYKTLMHFESLWGKYDYFGPKQTDNYSISKTESIYTINILDFALLIYMIRLHFVIYNKLTWYHKYTWLVYITYNLQQ